MMIILLLDLNGFNVIITTSLLFHLFDRAKYLWKKRGSSFFFIEREFFFPSVFVPLRKVEENHPEVARRY